ncbi:cell division protein FtsQ/DivIB [Bifidobacterium pongonis]|uniref:cell division protein FtsQ/DivIB n=1 Tax=Bifidobacterium pongonis TaxID=2834432 RepID=UPI0030846737
MSGNGSDAAARRKPEAKHPIKPSTRTQLRRTGANGAKQHTNAASRNVSSRSGASSRNSTSRNVPSRNVPSHNASGANTPPKAVSKPRKRTPYKSTPNSGSARNGRTAASAQAGQRRNMASGSAAGRGIAGGGRRTASSSYGAVAAGNASVSAPGSFVDARKLASEDLVAKTLRESAGTFGMAARPKIVDFTARAKERKRVSARIIIVRVAIVTLTVLLVIGLGWLLLFSPLLRLDGEQISVRGLNSWVSETEVRDLTTEQVGRSLLLVDTTKIISQAKNIPGVSDAEISKEFPHGLVVSLTTQRPAAILKTTNGRIAAVDSDYRVMHVISKDGAAGIPTIEVSDIETSVKNRSVKEAVKILDALPESLRKQITKVTAKTQDSVTTELNNGEHSVVWGDSSDIALKKADVDKILSDPNVIGDKTQVDVSSPYHPVLR